MKYKQTIRTTIIDGRNIIIGIDRASIAGPETNAIVDQEIKKTTEYSEVEKYRKSVQKYKDMALQEIANHKQAKTAEQKMKFWDAYIMRRDQHKDELAVLSNKKRIMQTKRREMMVGFAVYHEPKSTDKIVDDSVIDDYVSKFQTIESNQVLEFDMLSNKILAIPNYRGIEYYENNAGTWAIGKITEIGIDLPITAKTYEMLTDTEKEEIEAQRETERIAALSASAKLEEKQRALDAALGQSVNMRSGLEIQGDPDALTKSQDWYNAEVAAIEVRYG